jgi:hypothetical protein
VADSLHLAFHGHLPSFIAVPGETDVLMVVIDETGAATDMTRRYGRCCERPPPGPWKPSPPQSPTPSPPSLRRSAPITSQTKNIVTNHESALSSSPLCPPLGRCPHQAAPGKTTSSRRRPAGAGGFSSITCATAAPALHGNCGSARGRGGTAPRGS